jgi:hypothetical protein
MVHLFCHFILVEVFTACLTSDMVMTLYCSFRDIDSFAASFASWSVGDPTDTAKVAFTDGSCQGNPGPCGSGAVLYPGDYEGISLKRPVAQRGSILLTELVAILMVLEHCIVALKDGFTDIKILSDSRIAVGIMALNWKSSNYIDAISDIKKNIGTLMRYGMRTTLSWTLIP